MKHERADQASPLGERRYAPDGVRASVRPAVWLVGTSPIRFVIKRLEGRYLIDGSEVSQRENILNGMDVNSALPTLPALVLQGRLPGCPH